MRTRDELMKSDLPKWPQCLVTGEAISSDQALEIIRRTDVFFNCPNYSNDKEYEDRILDVIHCPKMPITSDERDDIKKYWNDLKGWHEKWGYIKLHYLYNDYVMSSMAQGCQGWCNPDGTIDYHFNIGKWPDVYEVFEDLCIIAKNFPFLKLECTLMNHEYCEDELPIKPVVSFLVCDGLVEVVDPEERDIHKENNRQIPKWTNEDDRDAILRMLHKGFDAAISLKTIQKWADDHL